jgi:hypothetical protein
MTSSVPGARMLRVRIVVLESAFMALESNDYDVKE